MAFGQNDIEPFSIAAVSFSPFLSILYQMVTTYRLRTDERTKQLFFPEEGGSPSRPGLESRTRTGRALPRRPRKFLAAIAIDYTFFQRAFYRYKFSRPFMAAVAFFPGKIKGDRRPAEGRNLPPYPWSAP